MLVTLGVKRGKLGKPGGRLAAPVVGFVGDATRVVAQDFFCGFCFVLRLAALHGLSEFSVAPFVCKPSTCSRPFAGGTHHASADSSTAFFFSSVTSDQNCCASKSTCDFTSMPARAILS